MKCPHLFTEEMKCFSTRYLVLPDTSKIVKVVLNLRKGDIFRRPSKSSVEEIEFNFVRFIECLNRLRSNYANTHQGRNFSGGNPTTSVIGSSRPETPLKQLFDQTSTSGTSINNYFGNTSPCTKATTTSGVNLELLEPDPDVILAEWNRQMEQNPISLPPKNTQTLPSSMFISYDFICWIMKSVDGLTLFDDAISFANKVIYL